MNFLEERIVKDGIVKEGNVLKVDSFLNHQMDIELFDQMGAEFKKRFADRPINKILTMIYWYTWKEFKCRINKIEIVSNTTYTRIRIISWDNWILKKHTIPPTFIYYIYMMQG